MSCTISFWTFVFHELHHLFLDSVDQLLALDQSGLASLLVVPVTDVCDCPRTVRQRLVPNASTTCSVRCWILSGVLTGLNTAPLPCMFLKTVVHVFFVVRVWRALDRVGHPRPLLSGIGVPKWHQNRAPTLCGCWSVVLWIRADTSKQNSA